jgi:hypothetical protein
LELLFQTSPLQCNASKVNRKLIESSLLFVAELTEAHLNSKKNKNHWKMLRFIALFALLLCGAHAIPQGMMLFFVGEDGCTNGWTEVSSTQGRLVVSVSDSSLAGVTVGSALADREDPQHTHAWNASVQLPRHDISAIGCCNDQGAANGVYSAASATLKSSTNYPLAQLHLCQWTNASDDTLPVPFGTIAYFDESVDSCPPDWAPYSEGSGRLLVPGYNESGTFSSPYPPLRSGEDRLHGHTFETTFATESVEYAGIGGCCDKGPASAGTVAVAGNTEAAASGLPYVQLLTCLAQNQTFDSAVPDAALLMNSVRCPPGYELATSLAGRFLLSLPTGGVAGATFGGASLDPSGTGQPAHRHGFAGSITPPSVGVGLASGCCASGYAKAQTYSFESLTADADINLPFLFVPTCIKI